MTNSIRFVLKLTALAVFTLPLLLSSPVNAQSVGAAQLSKLAKQFNVSPSTLAKFSDMNIKDLQSGLDMAKKLSSKGELSMDAAVDKVMGAAEGGQDWNSIGSDLGIDTGNSAGAVDAKIPTKLKKKLPN